MNFDLKRTFIGLAVTLLIEGVITIGFYAYIYPFFIGVIGGLVIVICVAILLLFIFLGKLPREEKSYSPTLYFIQSIVFCLFAAIFIIGSLVSYQYLSLAIYSLTMACYCVYIFFGLNSHAKKNERHKI